MKPRIGISSNQRTMIEASEAHWISYIPRNFVEGIRQAGGLPWLLPIGQESDAKDYVASIDKLLLIGGQDVDPRCYQELPHEKLGAIDPVRDAFELALIEEALTQQKPILAICRGMQLLNVSLGGNLYQDLSLRPDTTLKHVQLPTSFSQPTHPVKIDATSLLGQFLPENYQVNSFHHQTINTLGKGLKVIAQAPDGVIEAVENPEQRILGVQWHPELTCQNISSEQKIFDFFVQQL